MAFPDRQTTGGKLLIDNLFLSVGAIKAGTTWLFSQLIDHPDIFFTREKEIHYFAHVHTPDKPLSPERRLARLKQIAQKINDKGNLERNRRIILWFGNYLAEPVNDLWYVNLFCFRGRQKYCADFSNLYALLPDEGWEHVRRITRNVRVMYTMRDPLKRLWSHTRFHLQFTGRLDEINSWNRDDFKSFLNLPHVEVHTHYGDIVKRLKRNMSNDELRIYFFEEFRSDPEAMLRDVESFLDVKKKQFVPENLHNKVNSAAEIEMPEYFGELCKPIVDRECELLAKLGYDIPPGWGQL